MPQDGIDSRISMRVEDLEAVRYRWGAERAELTKELKRRCSALFRYVTKEEKESENRPEFHTKKKKRKKKNLDATEDEMFIIKINMQVMLVRVNFYSFNLTFVLLIRWRSKE